MSKETAATFHLPKGWTLRKMAGALAREWFSPVQALPAPKVARWVVQSVMEEQEDGQAPLWEPGISTTEYEERLDSSDVGWAIRATAGRGKGIILARLTLNKEQPGTFHLECGKMPFPERLLDPEKLQEVLKADSDITVDELFTTLMTNNGIQPVSHSH
jgi:hypothetical protein